MLRWRSASRREVESLQVGFIWNGLVLPFGITVTYFRSGVKLPG